MFEQVGLKDQDIYININYLNVESQKFHVVMHFLIDIFDIVELLLNPKKFCVVSDNILVGCSNRAANDRQHP